MTAKTYLVLLKFTILKLRLKHRDPDPNSKYKYGSCTSFNADPSESGFTIPQENIKKNLEFKGTWSREFKFLNKNN
jgi:hypothetical protein